MNIIKDAQSAYKSLTNSAHDIRVETNVEYEGGNKFKSTIKGKAKRNIKNGVNFFDNNAEFDSTFADNYGKDDSNIKDFLLLGALLVMERPIMCGRSSLEQIQLQK